MASDVGFMSWELAGKMGTSWVSARHRSRVAANHPDFAASVVQVSEVGSKPAYMALLKVDDGTKVIWTGRASCPRAALRLAATRAGLTSKVTAELFR